MACKALHTTYLPAIMHSWAIPYQGNAGILHGKE